MTPPSISILTPRRTRSRSSTVTMASALAIRHEAMAIPPFLQCTRALPRREAGIDSHAHGRPARVLAFFAEACYTIGETREKRGSCMDIRSEEHTSELQ